MQITQEDRDERGRIMIEAERRAAAQQEPPPARARTWSNRRSAPAAVPPADAQPRTDRRLVAGIVGALVVVLAVIGAISFLPSPTTRRPPATNAAPAVVPPTAAPAATIAPSATPAPPTATAEPPTQTPVVVYVETACYSVTQDVYSPTTRAVIGVVTGTSCESQEAAQANADTLAAEMKEGK